MKKLKHLVITAALAFVLSMAVKADSEAAQITGAKQTDAGTSWVDVSCNADLSQDTNYYVALVSQVNDGNPAAWSILGYDTDPNEIWISGLSAGQTYYVSIAACSDYDYDGNFSGITAEPSAVFDVVTAPSTTNLNVIQSSATKNQVSAKFSGVSGANYYRIGSRQTGGGITWLGASTSPTVTTTATLSAGSSYWLYCYPCRRSSSGFIASSSYDFTYFKTVSNTISTKNFGVSSAFANINVYYFEMNTGYGSSDGFQIQFKTMKGKTKKTLTSSGTSVRVSNIIAGNFYKYRVRTYINVGTTKFYSGWSGYKYIGMAKKYKGKTYSKRGTNSRNRIKVNWSKINGASEYVVYISTKENSGYKKVKTLKAKTKSITITKCGKKKLKKGKSYYVKVVAKAKSGKKKVTSANYWVGNGRIPRS